MTEKEFIPRLKIEGPTCSICNKTAEINDFLVKVRPMTTRGYLDTEICVPCFLLWKKDVLTKFITDVVKQLNQ